MATVLVVTVCAVVVYLAAAAVHALAGISFEAALIQQWGVMLLVWVMSK